MAVVDCDTYEGSVKLYENLVQLRSMRDLTLKDVAMRFRPRNKDGNIWYSAQFRPIYTQEAVADLATSIENAQTKSKIHWEDEWRKGEMSNWDGNLVTHESIDRVALQTPKALLEELKEKAKVEFNKLKTVDVEEQQQSQQTV